MFRKRIATPEDEARSLYRRAHKDLGRLSIFDPFNLRKPRDASGERSVHLSHSVLIPSIDTELPYLSDDFVDGVVEAMRKRAQARIDSIETER